LTDLFEREAAPDGSDKFCFGEVRHLANSASEQNRLRREDSHGASDCMGLVADEVGDVVRKCGVCLGSREHIANRDVMLTGYLFKHFA
jgi:hypothetical protein